MDGSLEVTKTPGSGVARTNTAYHTYSGANEEGEIIAIVLHNTNCIENTLGFFISSFESIYPLTQNVFQHFRW